MRASSVEYRTALKEKILVIAWKLFCSRGFKAVKMDDIAHELGISKRTLYEIYPTKEDVLYESFLANANSNLQKLRDKASEGSDVMDILTTFFRMHLQNMRESNPLFADEVKNIPRIKKLIEDTLESRRQKSLEFLRKGQEEGFFITNINMDIYMEMHALLSESLYGSSAYKQFQPVELFRTLVTLFIRSICTPLGLKRIDDSLEELEF